jgi:uncharacterized membrane protein YqjE
MADSSNRKGPPSGGLETEAPERGARWVLWAFFVGLAVLGSVYLHFRIANPVATLADHANLGNAMAPAVAFLTLLAVAAALWSVQIQRVELALQRQELRETREEMVEQRKQFERTAGAQEALAASQAQLAEAQKQANKIALSAAKTSLTIARNGTIAQRSQHGSNVATYMAAIAHVQSAIATIHAETLRTIETKDLQKEIVVLAAQRDLEARRMRDIDTLLEGEGDDGKQPT